MPGPSSGVEGSVDEDLRPKDGILLAMADSVPGMPMLELLLYGEGRPAAQAVSPQRPTLGTSVPILCHLTKNPIHGGKASPQALAYIFF